MNYKYTLFVKLSEDMPENIKSYYYNYKPAYSDDSGFDLPTSKSVIFKKNENPSKKIEFSVMCAMKNNQTNKYTGYYLYPRSSIYKYNLILWNSTGIIDAGYRGEIKAPVRWFNDSNDENLIINDERLFQICSPDLSAFDVKIVEDLPESLRGKSGFGSTGSSGIARMNLHKNNISYFNQNI